MIARSRNQDVESLHGRSPCGALPIDGPAPPAQYHSWQQDSRRNAQKRTAQAPKRPSPADRAGPRSAGKQRPPLGDKPLLMHPPLPYIYGREENENPPEWLEKAVQKVRATQPKVWPPGKTPWPQAPKGANASR